MGSMIAFYSSLHKICIPLPSRIVRSQYKHGERFEIAETLCSRSCFLLPSVSIFDTDAQKYEVHIICTSSCRCSHYIQAGF